VQLLERRLPEGQLAQLQLIDRQLDRITRLVSQLLDASAVGAGVIALDPRELELSAIVRRIAEGLAPSAPAHQLRLDLQPATGRWDELRLEQVLHNLVGNAIKFSPAGGPIDIASRQEEDGTAVVEIADRGIGLASEEKAKLFKRFGRGSGSNIGGFGVGLYVVREIVERHGGTVDLSPREGGGTVATVRLPREGPAVAGGTAAE
jgi:signal transduction histidine kinase